MLNDIEITHRALLAMRAAHELGADPAAMRRRSEAVLFDLGPMDLVRVAGAVAVLATLPRPAEHTKDRAAITRWLDMMEAELAMRGGQ
jgi:hypothetical protein